MCALIKSKQYYVSLYFLNIIFLFLVEENSKFFFTFNFPLRGIVSGSRKAISHCNITRTRKKSECLENDNGFKHVKQMFKDRIKG